ncbi:hypothetical protein DSM106972_065630 [Dulcicalothrix desertica PCC 7102]|uniref:Uncharacterized protein n=1 Tax=Dulcicalothrix desertica PCC 7102 TaxID=232991 RepID=A0A3S1C6Z4_9CYAN|nr:hypothetical protein [Dulcicalothrix desertica]RUT01466.1 hypothetical protein DSM106972_065630 [Dulcicalothrix desertica PCC 7102]TWH43497.1 hypothetical protein CAL7102_07225 [Dulcicalothrix desertica PCC 7102]
MTQPQEQENRDKLPQNMQAYSCEILQSMQVDIFKIIEETHKKIRSKDILPNDIQKEIAQQITLLQRFQEYILKIYKKNQKKSYNIDNIKYLQLRLNCFKIALDGLFEPPRELMFARKLRYETEYFLNRKLCFGFIKTLFQRATREFSTPTKVLFGLAMAIPIYAIIIPVSLTTSIVLTLMPDIAQIPTYLLIDAAKDKSNVSEGIKKPQVEPTTKAQVQSQLEDALQRISFNLGLLLKNSSLVIMVAFAGAFGSIVSIFIRLDQYKSTDYKESATPILVGFAKPLIGTAFAILVCSMLSSGIITSPLLYSHENSSQKSDENSSQKSSYNSEKQYFLYFTIAFLIGFSERLANDIVKRAEDTISPQDKTQTSAVVHKKTITQENISKALHKDSSMKQISREEVQQAFNTFNYIQESLLAHFQEKDKIEDSTTEQNLVGQSTDIETETEKTTIETIDAEIKNQTT